MRHQPLNNSSTGNNLTPNNSLLIQNRIYTESSLIPLEKVSRVRHLSLFERAPAAYVSGANFLS